MKMKESNLAIARKAAARAIATFPSVVDMAKAFDLHKVTIYGWEKNGVPIKQCPKVERLTGVPKELLHPEFFA